MLFIYNFLKAIAYPFSFLCGICCLGFIAILGIPSKRTWLLPVCILLSPLALAFALLAGIFYVLAVLIGAPAILSLSTHGAAENNGLRITLGRRRTIRLLKWNEIKEIRQVESLRSPFPVYCVLMSSGEPVSVDFINKTVLTAALDLHGIPFVKDNRLLD